MAGTTTQSDSHLSRRREPHRFERCTVVLVAAIALTVPLGVIPARVLGQPLFLFDAPSILLLGVGGWSFVARKRRARPGHVSLLAAAFFAFMAFCMVAFVVHPSIAGAVLMIRLGAGGALAWVVSGLSRRDWSYAAVALVTSAIVQSGIAMAQFLHKGPVGLRVLGEGSAPLNRLGEILIPRGTFNHQYPLTAFCLLAAIVGAVTAGRSRHPWRWLAASVVAILPLGVTFSRSGVLGLGLALACLCWVAWRHDRRYGPIAVCLALGLVFAAMLAARGWTGRIYQTIHSPTVNAFSSGRVTMYQDSVGVARDNLIVGTGPGRIPANTLPVNDVILLISEQAGVVAAIVAAGVVALLGMRAFKQGPLAASVFVALVPFVVFDFFLYGIPQGPAMAGLWAGAVCSPLVRRARSSAKASP